MLPSFYLGTWKIDTYWLMLAVGAFGMFLCVLYRRKYFPLQWGTGVIFTLILTVVGVLGAKLLFVLENLQETLENGLSLGGVSFFGSVFLILMLMPLVGRLFRLRDGQTLDLCAPCVAVMIGCMRVGCFLTGCCGGWEVCVGNWRFRWPTQAMDSIGDFAILLLLMQWEEQGKQKNLLYPWFMVFYSIMRFFIEFLRDTPKDWLFLSHGQWFSLAAVAIGGGMIVAANQNRKPTKMNNPANCCGDRREKQGRVRK